MLRYILIAIMLVSCGAPPKLHTVVYDAGTDAPTMSVTWSDPTGTQQMNNVPVPWKITGGALSGGAVSMTVQSGGDGYARCSITIDGNEVVAKRSEGAFSVATCVATVP